MSAMDKLKIKASALTTVQLFACMTELDKQMTGMGTPEQRMVYATMADTVEERHGLSEAVEAIYMDDNFTSTYREALEIAYCAIVTD